MYELQHKKEVMSADDMECKKSTSNTEAEVCEVVPADKIFIAFVIFASFAKVAPFCQIEYRMKDGD